MSSKITFTVLLVVTLALSSCSNTEETETEKGLLGEQTEAIGQEAARMLKTPMERASTATDKENLRIQQHEEQLNKIE